MTIISLNIINPRWSNN